MCQVLLCCAGFALSATAQSRSDFQTIATVNDSVITQFELDQRIRMIEALGSGGDLTKVAMDNLIDERLYAQAAKSLGVTATQDEIDAGVEEFATRGNLSGEELLAYLADKDVEELTFREFIKNGILWRIVVQSRFGRLAAVQDDEIERALNIGTSRKQLSFLMSEIILPKAERGAIETTRLANDLYLNIKEKGGFSEAASRYSASPTAENGGRRNWTPANELAPVLLTRLLTLDPGQITEPVDFPEFTAIFQLNGMRAEPVQASAPVTLNYLRVNLPASAKPDAAQTLIDQSDTCLDLRAVAEPYGPDATVETSVIAGRSAGQVGAELAKLDRFEATQFTNSAGGISVVMMCNRIRELNEESRDGLRQALFNQRITGLGDAYLQELKGQAFVVRK